MLISVFSLPSTVPSYTRNLISGPGYVLTNIMEISSAFSEASVSLLVESLVRTSTSAPFGLIRLFSRGSASSKQFMYPLLFTEYLKFSPYTSFRRLLSISFETGLLTASDLRSGSEYKASTFSSVYSFNVRLLRPVRPLKNSRSVIPVMERLRKTRLESPESTPGSAISLCEIVRSRS